MKKIIFAHPNSPLCGAWQQALQPFPEVETLNSRFRQVLAALRLHG